MDSKFWDSVVLRKCWNWSTINMDISVVRFLVSPCSISPLFCPYVSWWRLSPVDGNCCEEPVFSDRDAMWSFMPLGLFLPHVQQHKAGVVIGSRFLLWFYAIKTNICEEDVSYLIQMKCRYIWCYVSCNVSQYNILHPSHPRPKRQVPSTDEVNVSFSVHNPIQKCPLFSFAPSPELSRAEVPQWL